MRKGKRGKAVESKSLIKYYKQRKSRDPERGKQEDITDSGDESNAKQGKGFFACYLLTPLSPRFKGHTYIGYTVNPRRRIRQHNGEIGSGAWRTKSKRPWEMVICIYGFPTNVSALQFEWAWQHPHESVAVRQAAAAFKSFSGVANKIKLAYTMLTLPAWQSLNITVNFFSTKYRKDSACCPSLPEQMKVQVCSMDELPCYNEQDESEYADDCDTFDEHDEVNETFETVCRTEAEEEVVNVSADSLHFHESCYEQFEQNEENKTRKSGHSSTLGIHNIQPHVFIDSPTSKAQVEAAECADMSILGRESFREKQFTYAVEASEDPEPWVRASTTYEGYEKPGKSSTFGGQDTQTFDFIDSPVRTSPSTISGLSHGETPEGDKISFFEKECPSQKQFSAVLAPNIDQQPREKPLTTEVAVMEDQLPSSSTVTHEVEVIDLLTPSPDCGVKTYTKKRRISKFSPEIIDLT